MDKQEAVTSLNSGHICLHCIVLKRKRLFTSLDRNDLKWSLRISEMPLSMNAKVLFLVIGLASAIFYVTRHVVIYEVLCIIS